MNIWKRIKDTESKLPDIWNIHVWWIDNDLDEEYKEKYGEENSVSFSHFPSKMTKEELTSLVQPLLDEYLEHKEKSPAQVSKFTINHKGKHRWWLTWFAHETNQRFESRADAMADFDNWYYKSGLNRWVDWTPAGSNINNDIIWCPMGANDYWRRKVCECDDCKENGICRITH